jgi:DNA-binding response OmpR family regulator
LIKRFWWNYNWNVFIIWNIKIDLDAKKISKNNEEIKFTIKEFNILETLLNNRWIAISRTSIIEELWWWDTLFEWDGKLDVYISGVRKNLWKSFIETIKWFGYKIDK